MTGASESVRYPHDESLRQASLANSGAMPRFSKVPEVTLGFRIIISAARLCFSPA